MSKQVGASPCGEILKFRLSDFYTITQAKCLAES